MNTVPLTDMTGLKGPFQIMPIKQYRRYGKMGSGGGGRSHRQPKARRQTMPLKMGFIILIL
jgi:hypothetical protein